MKMEEVTTRMLYKAVRYLWEVEKELLDDVSDREATASLDKKLAELEHIRVAIACIDAEFTRRVQDDK